MKVCFLQRLLTKLDTAQGPLQKALVGPLALHRSLHIGCDALDC